MKSVFLGVGHGGSDSGAVANNLKEKDINLIIALACKEYLEVQGIEVQLSRYKDENDPIMDEVKKCNAFNPDLAIDIHTNAGGGKGFEVFYYSGGGLSKTLAQNIESEVISIGQTSRGVKTKVQNGTDYYAFIRETNAAAVITECAFIDNSTDVQMINTIEKQKAFGVAYAKGILKTLGVKAELTSDSKMECPQYKKDGEKYLRDMLYITSEHDPEEVIDFGTLGVILMNYNKTHKSA